MRDKIIKALTDLKEKGRRMIFFRWTSADSEGAFKYINLSVASAEDIRRRADGMEAELHGNHADKLYISSHRNGRCYTRTLTVA